MTGPTLAELVRTALDEDIGSGDVTTRWTVEPDARGSASIIAKQEIVVAGTEAAVACFLLIDDDLVVEPFAGDGAEVSEGDPVLRVAGRLASILTGERTALNFLAHLSGIATLTGRYVDAVRGTGALILDTRKTTPGLRALEKAAVRAGGGTNHRMGLSDMVLLKDNHIVAAGGLATAIARIERESHSSLPVEVEVSDAAELETALSLGVRRILLDNMEVEALARAVRRCRELGDERPQLEASGNVSLETVRAIAETGVDRISVGALTHSAPAVDLTLRLGE